MSEPINDGGAAFPIPPDFVGVHGETARAYEGMSLRAYFAGRAAQALISNYQASMDICNNDPRYTRLADGQYNFAEVVSRNAVEFADALIAELAKPKS